MTKRFRRQVLGAGIGLIGAFWGAGMETAQSQIPLPNSPNLPASQRRSWVRLDGRPLFPLAAGDNPERVTIVQNRLNRIQAHFLQGQNPQPQVDIRRQGGSDVIYVNDQYLLTITHEDAQARAMEVQEWAEELQARLEVGLAQSWEEHQPQYLSRMLPQAAGIAALTLFTSGGLYLWHQRRHRPAGTESGASHDPMTTEVRVRNRQSLRAVEGIIHGHLQAGLWWAALFSISGFFPQTRWLQGILFTNLLVLLVIPFGMYALVRASYILIDRFAAALALGVSLTTDPSRVELRFRTLSNVTKGFVALVGVAVGIALALAVVGLSSAPLLAGAGLIGVGISLAAQNIIRDHINGLLIIVEDQFGVGDVIAVGTYSGVVERLNLRITQLRDAEGRLITLPNSEIRAVANLSSQWSRADIQVLIPHRVAVAQALKVVRDTVAQFYDEVPWQELILEAPQVLGVDAVLERGSLIRVWIKTLPLKQWEVKREVQRRLKLAFEAAGLDLTPFPLSYENADQAQG
ncbi:MAG: mechanosensitive ion channel [Gloeomargaritaceae cyanobacterium C42_A2020_066]|nr:mechanosensitive ion channel [Gloeomargaritaceae cyanobacterium C42_A2020_066]